MGPPSGLGRLRWIILGAWTLAIAASLTWNLFWQDRVAVDLAHAMAVTLFQKDLLFRRWVTNHGGVYVPITTETQPNPHLKHPEREIFTPAGWPLTLINPAYMSRQLYELAREAGYPQGRLSSLKPLNPVNQPDPWERKALLALEQGRPEVVSVDMLEGQPMLRLMRPFITETGCLKCHADQGYKVGDLRGGITLAVPLKPLYEANRPIEFALAMGHLFLWLLGVLGVVFAFGRLQKAEDQIITMMRQDALTGLANRRYFLEILNQAISFAVRHNQPLSLVMADLDFFKAINDSLGHDAGDRVLTAYAALLQQNLRKEDLPSRYGGEEFFLLLPATDAPQAAALAERIRKSLEDLDIEGIDRRVTASFGVTQYLPDDTPETLTKRADEALYEAKKTGRNQVRIIFSSPLST